MSAKLTYYRHNDKSWTISFTDDSDNPIDITDWTVWFTVKEKKNDSDADAVVQKVIESHDAPGDGQTSILLESGDIGEDITAGRYYYDIQVKKSDGTIVTILEDSLEIKEPITKSTSVS